MTSTINTHHVHNPTGSTITVGANSVLSHSSADLTLSDSDVATFVAAGARPALLMPGVATVDQIRGYVKE